MNALYVTFVRETQSQQALVPNSLTRQVFIRFVDLDQSFFVRLFVVDILIRVILQCLVSISGFNDVDILPMVSRSMRILLIFCCCQNMYVPPLLLIFQEFGSKTATLYWSQSQAAETIGPREAFDKNNHFQNFINFFFWNR